MLTSIFAHAHVLFIHGPIALVLVVLVVEAYFRARGRPSPRDVVRVLLVVAGGSAVLSVASGLTFASIEDFHGRALRALELHRNVAIGATVLALIAIALHFWSTTKAQAFTGYMVALTLAGGGVAAAGHLGGELVHGEGYLLRPAGDGAIDDGPIVASDGDDDATGGAARDRNKDDPSILTRGEKIDYVRDVKPIFERSCLKCHGPEKRKGKLRLDKKKYAMHGGEAGDDIVPGDPDKSLVVKMVSLPSDDEDVMPEKGKLLSVSEIEVLRRWIKEGAHWPDDG